MPLFNRQTGEQATPAQQAEAERVATDILRDPYAAPELMAWAMDVAPGNVVETTFWESVAQQKLIRDRQARAAIARREGKGRKVKSGLSGFANYCRDRGITCLFTGRIDNTLLFTVRWPRDLSSRVRSGFEKRIRADNPDSILSILYRE